MFESAKLMATAEGVKQKAISTLDSHNGYIGQVMNTPQKEKNKTPFPPKHPELTSLNKTEHIWLQIKFQCRKQ